MGGGFFFEEWSWRTILGALVLMCCGIAWFGIASLLGGWAQTVMITLFGVLFVATIVRGYHLRSNRMRDEWRRGGRDGDFDEFP